MPVSTDTAVPSSIATTPVVYPSNQSSIDSMSDNQNSSIQSMGSSLAVPQNVPPASSVPPMVSPMNTAMPTVMTSIPQSNYHANVPLVSMSSIPSSGGGIVVPQNVVVVSSLPSPANTSNILVQSSLANSSLVFPTSSPGHSVASSSHTMPVPLNIPIPPAFPRNVSVVTPQNAPAVMHTSSPVAFPGLSPAPPSTPMMASPQSSPHPSNSSASLGAYPLIHPDCSTIKTEDEIKTEPIIKQEADNTEKPHKCESCGRCYKKLTGLYSHKRYECGKPPIHFCPVCPTKCKQKGNLVAHLKRKHPDFADSYSTKRGSSIPHRFAIPIAGQQFPVAPLLYNPHYFHHRSMQESEQRRPSPIKPISCKDPPEQCPELRQFTDLMPPVKPQHSHHQSSQSSHHSNMMRQSSSSTSHHSSMMRQASSHHHGPDVGSSKNQCEMQQSSLSLADLTNPSNDGKVQQPEDDFSSFSIQQYYL